MPDSGDLAIVIGLSKARCRVFDGAQERECLIPPQVAVKQKSALAVGDRVATEMAEGVCRLVGIAARKTVLSRPDPINAHRQRLIAANVDRVIHVVSIKAPPLRLRLIDRYLIAIQRGGAEPIVCVNKIDLVDDDEKRTLLAVLDPYRRLPVPVVAVSTKSGEGLDELRDLARGHFCALVGHSGVGKSSILNALDEGLQIATGELHRRGTGRHTTTSSTLHDLGDDTWIIDTPGIREFGLWDLDPGTLRDYFPEFAEPGESCKFNDCTHLHEPGCEVKEQVDAGTLNRARYDTYTRLAEDLAEGHR